MNGKPTVSPLWYLFIAFLIFWAMQLFLAPRPNEITYSDFKKALGEGKVEEVSVSEKTIKGVMKPEAPDGEKKPFMTLRVEDKDLVSDLSAHGVKYKGEIEATWLRDLLLFWILPMLILIGVWSFIMRRIGGGVGGVMSIGKSRAKLYVEKETKTTFDDVAGIDEAKEELMEVIEFLRNPEKFQRLGGRIPKGVLLVGPPGTGKTLLAKAVAGEAKVNFLSISGADFVEMFVGVGAARVRDLFAQGQDKAPCIIFIDELDAVGRARGMGVFGGDQERDQTLNQLLAEMDGFDTRKGVIIMAATNRPEVLDPALLRPGRFDRQIVVDRPDLKGREEILKVHLKNVKVAEGMDIRVLAARTPGFVGADLANIVNEAALLSARKGKDAVGMDEFEEAIDRVIAGLEKKKRVMSKKEKEITAFHESGHALVAEFLPDADKIHKVSIIPRGVAALGYTLQLPTEDRYLLTKSELLDKLSVLLGGRVAEELIFNEISTGAQNDLMRATDIARSMVKEYGMSEKLGLVTFEKERRPLFLDVPGVPSREYSEEIAREIDREVKRIIDEAYEKVKGILSEHRDILERLAKRLLEKEVVEKEELKGIVYGEKAAKGMEHGAKGETAERAA
jgi:cell division protease FtsH